MLIYFMFTTVRVLGFISQVISRDLFASIASCAEIPDLHENPTRNKTLSKNSLHKPESGKKVPCLKISAFSVWDN